MFVKHMTLSGNREVNDTSLTFKTLRASTLECPLSNPTLLGRGDTPPRPYPLEVFGCSPSRYRACCSAKTIHVSSAYVRTNRTVHRNDQIMTIHVQYLLHSATPVNIVFALATCVIDKTKSFTVTTAFKSTLKYHTADFKNPTHTAHDQLG